MVYDEVGGSFRQILISIILCTSFNICKSQTKQYNDSWVSKNPLSIPLKARQAYKQKGNLVLNPSFERVKSSNGGDNIRFEDWKIIGKHVQVTDTRKATYNSNDALKGNHAIKIIRTGHSVKNNNQSEGVLSNFIRVIPGKYEFTYFTRLVNIIPSSYPDSRYQTKVRKGIDIHLLFFDKNKNKIGQRFEGFSFYNFYQIHNFKWGLVRGLSDWGKNPFSFGYVPNECRYIKIFLGLKDQGTMWVDKVNYHYSKWNFTTLERMDSLFTKKYDLTDLLIPMPRVVKNKTQMRLTHKNIALSYGGTNSAVIKKALELLQKKFKKVHGHLPKINKTNFPSNSSTGLSIIFIKNRSPFSTEFEAAFDAIKNKDQGYFIRRKGDRIYIGANTVKGIYYGACSLSQLIDSNHSTLDYADITDWPDFKGRSVKLMTYESDWKMKHGSKLSTTDISEKQSERDNKLKKQLEVIDEYAFYKLNNFYLTRGSLGRRHWWDTGRFYKKFVQEMGSKIKNHYGNTLTFALQFNPTIHLANYSPALSSISDSVKKIFSYGTKEGFNKVKNKLTPALNAGVTTVMFCADDFIPHPDGNRAARTLFTRADKAKFINLAEAQAYMLNELESWLDKNYGDIRLEFVPTMYYNQSIDRVPGQYRSYFHDLNRKLDSSIPFLYTGRVTRSFKYDMASIRRAEKIYDRKPMIWDNTPYARRIEANSGRRPRRAVLANLFEPFNLQYPKDFSKYFNSHYYSNNGGGINEINKIKNITFGEFTWNTEDYRPEFALYKVLVKKFGKENAKHLLQFSDAYYRFVSTWAQLKKDKSQDSNYECNKQQINKAKRQIEAIKRAFLALKAVKNKALKEELKQKTDSKIGSLQKLCKENNSIKKKL